MSWIHFLNPSLQAEPSKMKWLIQLRYLALAYVLFVCIYLTLSQELNKNNLHLILGVWAIYLMFNLALHMFSSEISKKNLPWFVNLQMFLDILVLTGFILISKTYSTALVLLYMVSAGLAGLLIKTKSTWGYLLVLHSLLFWVQLTWLHKNDELLEEKSLLSSMVFHHIFCFIHWFILRFLGEALDQQNAKDLSFKINLEKQDRLRTLGALTSGFSHEFASPLNTLKIRVQRLHRKNPSEDAEVALACVNDCENIIRQMNLSQMDSRSYLKKNIFLGQTIEALILEWKKDHPQAVISCSGSADVQANLPVLQFSQILFNILDNAFESNPNGSIEVSFFAKNNTICLGIKDQGPGFSQPVLDRMGEPFNTSKTLGTGLGLYLTEIFIQSLGGQMRIENLKPVGASVSLIWSESPTLKTDIEAFV